MKVIALERCYDGKRFIEVDEIFEVPDDAFDADRVILSPSGGPLLDEHGNKQYHPLPTAIKPVEQPKAKKSKSDAELV